MEVMGLGGMRKWLLPSPVQHRRSSIVFVLPAITEHAAYLLQQTLSRAMNGVHPEASAQNHRRRVVRLSAVSVRELLGPLSLTHLDSPLAFPEPIE